MAKMQVYDPALCCSTGVCGAEVDPTLVRFAADLEWLGKQGGEVRRYNLAQEPTAFALNALVRHTLQQEGTDCLPLILVGGEIVSRGRYPARNEMAEWSGIVAAPESSTVEATPKEQANDRAAAPASGAGDARNAPAFVALDRSPRPRGRSSDCC